jgi:hypothetical protein
VKGVDRPAGGSIQNGLSRSLISQSFLPKGDTNRRFRRTLRNKRFSGASNGSVLDPTQFAQSLDEGSSPGRLRRR